MRDSIPNVLFIESVNPGVGYYRIFSFAKKMHELGLAKTKIFPEFDPYRIQTPDWERDLFKDCLPILSGLIEWADFVVLQYISSPEGLSLAEAIKDVKPCYMEVDDYFSQVPYYSISYDFNKPGDSGDFWSLRQMMISTGVITTTQYLADRYKEYNDNIHVIPNCIDFDVWDSYKSHSNENIRIGWIGGATHDGDLRIVKEVLYDLLIEYKNIEVYIVTHPAPNWKKVDRMNLMTKWVTIDKYPEHVKNLSFDIGLSPLRDNYFNRAKSNLRYLEYSACKCPTVASNVEPFKTNYAGMIAEDEMDWFDQLSLLIKDQDLRLKKGFKAYFDVKEKFNLEVVARDYAAMIEGALNSGLGKCSKSYIELGIGDRPNNNAL